MIVCVCGHSESAHQIPGQCLSHVKTNPDQPCDCTTFRRSTTAIQATPSTIDHPVHYNAGRIECIDALEAMLGPEGFQAFCVGNAIKYLWRYRHKGSPTEDLKKAAWYLDRVIPKEKKP